MSPKDARPLTTHLITPAVPALLQPRCLIFYPHGSQAKPEWSLISWQSRDLPLAFYQLLFKGRGGRKERTFSFALRPSFQSNRFTFGHRHPKNTRFSIRTAKLPSVTDGEGAPLRSQDRHVCSAPGTRKPRLSSRIEGFSPAKRRGEVLERRLFVVYKPQGKSHAASPRWLQPCVSSHPRLKQPTRKRRRGGRKMQLRARGGGGESATGARGPPHTSASPRAHQRAQEDDAASAGASPAPTRRGPLLQRGREDEDAQNGSPCVHPGFCRRHVTS